MAADAGRRLESADAADLGLRAACRASRAHAFCCCSRNCRPTGLLSICLDVAKLGSGEPGAEYDATPSPPAAAFAPADRTVPSIHVVSPPLPQTSSFFPIPSSAPATALAPAAAMWQWPNMHAPAGPNSGGLSGPRLPAVLRPRALVRPSLPPARSRLCGPAELPGRAAGGADLGRGQAAAALLPVGSSMTTRLPSLHSTPRRSNAA